MLDPEMQNLLHFLHLINDNDFKPVSSWALITFEIIQKHNIQTKVHQVI